MPFGSNVNVKIFMKTVASLVYVYNRPWGTEEFVLFEMQVFIKDSSGEINEIGQVLKFVYNE